MSQLKDQFFQPEHLRKLAEEIKKTYPEFQPTAFLKSIKAAPWDELELMDRMRKITDCLMEFLPDNYSDALAILREIAGNFKGFDSLVFADFVQRYGVDYPDESIPALVQFTELCSSEFAVRPFIVRYPKHLFEELRVWAKSENMHHRRLASEGCRPRLPWASALKELKQDPAPIFPILELLKNDPEEYVRRSVANNLNDISKDHPDLVIKKVKAWKGQSKETDWIIKHACRTMLKQGRRDVMQLFGFAEPSSITATSIEISPDKARIGDKVTFGCCLKTARKSLGKLRLEYVVYFIKANGKASPKVFQISERMEPSKELEVKKKHSFINLSTRKHFPGVHRFEIRVNGVAKAEGCIKLESSQ